MADEPKLVTALEVRLNTFEKQLKEAGLIAEREVKNIEDKFSRANPQFSGTFLGSFLGTAAAQGLKALTGLIEDLIGRFRELEKTAKLVNIEMQSLFGLQEAAHKFGAPIDEVTKSVRSLGELLDQMKRGEENSLSKLFDANPQALKGINRDALDLQQTLGIVSNLVQNARTEIQKIDLAKAAGQAESMVPFLEKGAKEIEKLQKVAADSAPDLQLLANKAKDFDKAWTDAITHIKAYIVTGFVDEFYKAIESTIQEVAAILNFFKGGVFAGGPLDTTNSKLRETVDLLQEKIKYARLADAFGTDDRTLAGRRSGDVAGGGTTTRAAGAPLSNVPSKATGGSDRDRFDASVERIEKRTAVLIAENEAINLGTEAREAAKIKAELLTVAEQVNGEVNEKQLARINAVSEAYGRAALAMERARSPLQTWIRDSGNLEKQLNSFAAGALDNLANSIVDVINNTKSMGDAFRQLGLTVVAELEKIIIKMLIVKAIQAASGGFGFADGGIMSSEGPIASPFAGGGIMSSSGSMPLRRYAGGGVATGPQMAVFGEGSMNEAYVPLPDGRSIPVVMKGGGQSSGDMAINVSVDVSGARGDGEIEQMTVAAVQSGVHSALKQYDSALPGRLKDINRRTN